jgi:(p)ppGpp synthase/HD superfamily hydrolase
MSEGVSFSQKKQVVALLGGAIAFAADKHRHQRRKNALKEPYINHPVGVMRILMEAGVYDCEILAAALLHDVCEDQGVENKQIENMFGAHVAGIVAAVTSDKKLSKREQKMAQLEHAKTMDFDASVVKQADRVHNLETLADGLPANWSPEYALGYLAHSFLLAENLTNGLPALSQQIIDNVKRFTPEKWNTIEWNTEAATHLFEAYYA